MAVVGPTGTGKSDLALALAERLDGEVVNGDALQFYRGMDIGTAKLAMVELAGGMGYMKDSPVERYYRDQRLLRIYEGTSEIQKLIIARSLLA